MGFLQYHEINQEDQDPAKAWFGDTPARSVSSKLNLLGGLLSLFFSFQVQTLSQALDFLLLETTGRIMLTLRSWRIGDDRLTLPEDFASFA